MSAVGSSAPSTVCGWHRALWCGRHARGTGCLSESLRQAEQVQGLRLGCCNFYLQYKLGDVRIEHGPAEKGLGILTDGRLYMSQQYTLTAQKANHIPGCMWSSAASRVKEGICPSALRWETSPGALRPCVESSVHKRHRPVGVHPEEGCKHDPRDGTPPYEEGWESWDCAAWRRERSGETW